MRESGVTSCTHDRYKQGHHSTADKALQRMKSGQVVWRGIVITHCEDCGADISEHRIVPVLTPDEWMGKNIK